MKLLLFTCMFLTLSTTPSLADEMTYAKEVEITCNEYHSVLDEIENTLADIDRLYAEDKETLSRIHRAQEAWESYINNHIDALYHGGTPVVGSVHKLCICHLMMPIVETRVQQLRYWRDGTFEGDVCVGHVRRADEESAP